MFVYNILLIFCDEYMFNDVRVFMRNILYELLLEDILKKRDIKEVILETSAFCNLRCVACFNYKMKRRRGFMTLDNFKKIIDKFPKSIKMIRMNWSGEPTLNKDTFKMVRYASSKGIKTHISANVTVLDKFSEKDIVESGLYSIAICIDGTTKKVHESYRVGSDFDKILKNAIKFGKIVRKNKIKTKIILQTLLIKGNTDIGKIEELGRKIFADEIHLRYFSVGLESIGRRSSNYDKFVPEDEKMIIYSKSSKSLKSSGKCNAFFTPVICWNGDVTICCFDTEAKHKYGNLLDESFESILKKMPLKRIFNRDYSICNNCDVNEEKGINYKVINL